MNEEVENSDVAFNFNPRMTKVQGLINKIQLKNYEPFYKWSDQSSGGSKTYLKEQIRSFIEIVSGVDVASLIKDLLSDIEKEFIQEKELMALKNIGNLYSSQNGHFFRPKIKRIIVKELKLSGLTRKKVNILGKILIGLCMFNSFIKIEMAYL